MRKGRMMNFDRINRMKPWMEESASIPHPVVGYLPVLGGFCQPSSELSRSNQYDFQSNQCDQAIQRQILCKYFLMNNLHLNRAASLEERGQTQSK
jgi:hypothetical protein